MSLIDVSGPAAADFEHRERRAKNPEPRPERHHRALFYDKLHTSGPDPHPYKLNRAAFGADSKWRPSNLICKEDMNTPGSMALGWGLLIVAGGGGLYFAKKDINQRRREQARIGMRSDDKLEWHQRLDEKTPASKPGEASSKLKTSQTETETGSLSNTFSKFDRPYQRTGNNSAHEEAEPKG
ncbi:hypothetical protein DFH28DRAFT_901847 [Melampsora americana]|nr:hypothetical protein DFH28DRAFT_901847 [Melampsora americana]